MYSSVHSSVPLTVFATSLGPGDRTVSTFLLFPLSGLLRRGEMQVHGPRPVQLCYSNHDHGLPKSRRKEELGGCSKVPEMEKK